MFALRQPRASTLCDVKIGKQQAVQEKLPASSKFFCLI